MLDLLTAEEAQHRALPSAFPCDVDILGPGRFQRQPDKLAAPLYSRPIVKLIRHIASPGPRARDSQAAALIPRSRSSPEARCYRRCGRPEERQRDHGTSLDFRE